MQQGLKMCVPIYVYVYMYMYVCMYIYVYAVRSQNALGRVLEKRYEKEGDEDGGSREMQRR